MQTIQEQVIETQNYTTETVSQQTEINQNIEPAQELVTTDSVNYTYDGNNNEITVSNTEPEPEPKTVNDIVYDTNTSMDVSYSSNGASETPMVEKYENKVENKNNVNTKEEQISVDEKIQQLEEERKRKNEYIKMNRGIEHNAWTKNKK